MPVLHTRKALLWLALGAVAALPAAGAQFNVGDLLHKKADDTVKDAARQEALHQIAAQIGQDTPTVSSQDATFPTVPTLPSASFHPTGDTSLAFSQFVTTTDGSVQLPPGDYEFTVRCQCMKASGAHNAGGHLFRMAPIKGRRAIVITILNARTAGTDVPGWQVQHLSWDIQAGLRYDQLPDNERVIVDRYLSNYRNELAGNPVDQARETYDKYASKAGMGSFDSALSQGKLGEAGRTVLEMEDLQRQLASSNSPSGVLALVSSVKDDKSEEKGGPTLTPWSRVSDRVYERLYSANGYMSEGTLQIRVLPSSVSRAQPSEEGTIRLAAYNPLQHRPPRRYVGDPPPNSASVPITSLEGEPHNEHIQPLSVVPVSGRTVNGIPVPPPSLPPVPPPSNPPDLNQPFGPPSLPRPGNHSWSGTSLLDVLRQAMMATEFDKVEHGGYARQTGPNKWEAWEDGKGTPEDFSPGPPPDGPYESWHTHPPASDTLSGSDKGDQYAADVTGKPQFAADPNGDIIENEPRPGHQNDQDPGDVQGHGSYNGPGVSVFGRWQPPYK